ncbi:MAG TPA: hypothetical protein VJ972_07330 [Anaerolineales bacterium]|nr:hypothetical protein [Anaerolineales bacterium]
MKIKKQYKHFVSFVVIVILVGCSVLNSSKTSTPSPTVSQEVNTTPPDVTSPSPVMTLVPASETVSVCPEKGKHVPVSSKSGISGTIIYQNDDSTGLYSIGGTPITSSQLLADETQQNVIFGFSPDGKWLAYSPFDTSSGAKFESFEVILLSADGEKIEHVLSTIEFEDELQVDHQLVGVSGISYWINSNMLYVTLYSQNPDPNTSGYISDLPKVFNPFDGEWNNQFLDLPDHVPSGGVGISPDMSRALYKEKGFSLWDYDRKVQIWHEDSLISPFRTLISWSPDGSMAAYASLYDDFSDEPVFVISRDGNFMPIMNKTIPVPGMIILNISWSPDSQYLALAGRDGENLIILVYDVASEKYISQCPVAKVNGIFPSLVWSPDSSHIAISDIDSPLLVFDVLSGDILELAQHGRALGWSDKFPVTWP